VPLRRMFLLYSRRSGAPAQVLTNLTGNAVKFTSQGRSPCGPSLVSQTDQEALIRFSIKDTGIGIPAGKQELLFEKFVQADPSTHASMAAPVWGLAISKQLAEMMGGEVRHRERRGQGSEFGLPSVLPDRPSGNTPLCPWPRFGGAMSWWRRQRHQPRGVDRPVGGLGVRSEVAPNGPLALQALYLAQAAGDPFQVAILDMQMPGMDGASWPGSSSPTKS